MVNDRLIALIDNSHGITNEYGDYTYTEIDKVVYATIKTVGHREKYEALQAGLDPEYVFIIRNSKDYNNEQIIKYNNLLYRVIRVYQSAEKVELTVTRYGSTS